MLKFLTHKLRTHSLNEESVSEKVEERDSGTESDDDAAPPGDFCTDVIMKWNDVTDISMGGEACACAPAPPRLLPDPEPDHLYDHHSSEEELEVINGLPRGAEGASAAGGAGGGEAELRRQLRERDERLLALEGECAKWEQRYLEEAALRQAAVSAASIPKDAKIAALEKTSAESERLMAEARNEKIRHMDELHSAQKKLADLEGRVKELESKVAERDAMIKVLQKHTSAAYDSGASLRNNSSREELVGLSSGASFSSAEGGGSVAGRYRHLARRNYSPHNDNSSGCGFDSTSLRLDEQLAALESRLERPPVPAVSYLPPDPHRDYY